MKMIGVEPLCHYRRSKSMAIYAIIDLNGILIFFPANEFPFNLAKAIEGKVALITHL